MTILCQVEHRSVEEATEEMGVDSHARLHSVFLQLW